MGDYLRTALIAALIELAVFGLSHAQDRPDQLYSIPASRLGALLNSVSDMPANAGKLAVLEQIKAMVQDGYARRQVEDKAAAEAKPKCDLPQVPQ